MSNPQQVKFITTEKITSAKLKWAGAGITALGFLQLVFAPFIVPLFTGLFCIGIGVVIFNDGRVKDYRDDRGRRLKRIPDDELPAEYQEHRP